MNDIKSILLDNSFLIRLYKKDDEFHKNVFEYFNYFLNNKIKMYLSAIVVSEYAVANDPAYLEKLNVFKIIEFNYLDAVKSGDFRAFLKGINQTVERNIVINDIKLLAQIDNRKIDAIISKDRNMETKMIKSLTKNKNFKCKFFNLTIPLKDLLGELF